MHKLSLSKAWEEAKAIAARDGRLLASVALALVALPTAVSTLITPNGMSPSNALWIDIVVIIASLVALAGQLALIRLATGPSITVGAAIAHGMRRMPFYFLAVVMVAIVVVLAAIPLALALVAMGVEIEQAPKAVSGPLLAAAVLYLILLLYVAVRMIMVMAIQSVVVLVVNVALGPVDPLSASALVVALAQALANAAISAFFAV